MGKTIASLVQDGRAECTTCGHAPHVKMCRVRVNIGTVHETLCGCNGEPCRTCNGSGFVDDGYGEVDACPSC
jgi:hypothetical protein